MEELTVNGIVVGGEDVGEADRLVRLLTPELGVIAAKMRGVKKEKAKLKFAAMPFSFCEYVLIKRGAYYSVKTASQTESLFGVTSSPDRYVIGSVMLEAAAAAAGTDSAEIFVELLTALKTLIYSDTDAYSVGLNFVYRLLVHGGHIAAGRSDGDYNVPVSEQKSLPRGRSERLLKAYLGLFSDKFCRRLLSAELIGK